MSLKSIHWQCLQMSKSVILRTLLLSLHWHEYDDACDGEDDSGDTC